MYIYCSNESNVDVFFDNLEVIHSRGPLLEATHYYPFGLTMAGISSKAAGVFENTKQRFQGQEFTNDFDISMYEFKYRMEDCQTGRFWQIDPLADRFIYNSTYAFSENKVTSHFELEGLEAVDIHMYARMGLAQDSKDPAALKRNVQAFENGYHAAAPQKLGIITDFIPGVNIAKWIYQAYTGKDFFTDEKLSTTEKVLNFIPIVGEFRGASSVWRMTNSLERGLMIEKALGGNLPKNFPVIDKLVDGVATSIKSVDLTAKSYNEGNGLLSTLKGYVNKLDNFTTATREGVTATEGVNFTSKSLRVAIEPGKASLQQWEQISEAIKYAKDKGINFNLQFVK